MSEKQEYTYDDYLVDLMQYNKELYDLLKHHAFDNINYQNIWKMEQLNRENFTKWMC